MRTLLINLAWVAAGLCAESSPPNKPQALSASEATSADDPSGIAITVTPQGNAGVLVNRPGSPPFSFPPPVSKEPDLQQLPWTPAPPSRSLNDGIQISASTVTSSRKNGTTGPQAGSTIPIPISPPNPSNLPGYDAARQQLISHLRDLQSQFKDWSQNNSDFQNKIEDQRSDLKRSSIRGLGEELKNTVEALENGDLKPLPEDPVKFGTW